MSQINRRKFLKLVSAGTCGAAVHQMISPYGALTAVADPRTSAAIGSSPVFILVNLAGGCSYNSAPIYNSLYRDANPNVSFSEAQSLVLNAEQGLHPSLTAFKSLYDEGHLALLNLVGYPNHNRSHDESTNIWFRGVRGMNNMATQMGGWGARLTCQMETIFSGVSLGGSNVLISGDCNPPRSYGSLEGNALGENAIYEVGKTSADATQSLWARNSRDNLVAASDAIPASNPNRQYLTDQVNNLNKGLATIRTAANKALPNIAPVTFPGSGFGSACRDAARLLNSPELGVRFIFLQRGGFDTHAGERADLTGNLNDVNAGLAALIASAKAMGRWQDVVIVTMSEFCRTFENKSAGTDHGAAAPMFVAGGGVRGGILTPTPTSADIQKARTVNPSDPFFRDYHVDFRTVFQEIVTNMGYNAGEVFPESFTYTPLGLFA